MGTTASSKLKHKGVLLPEEQVRQHLIQHMTGPLGYPKGLLVVERALHTLPHLATVDLKCPNRRLDLLCFGRGIHPKHPLYPLLLVECKATPLSDKVKSQVAGYNRYVGAYFIAIANQTEIETGTYDAKESRYHFTKGLPPYESLLSHCPHS